MQHQENDDDFPSSSSSSWCDLRAHKWLPLSQKYGRFITVPSQNHNTPARRLWTLYIPATTTTTTTTTLILIHGLGGRAEQWYDVLEYFLQQGNDFSIIIPNLYGHGRSEKPLSNESAYSPSLMLGDMQHILKTLVTSDDTVYAAGHSFGSLLSAMLCDRIDGCVLIGSTYDPPPANPLIHCPIWCLECIRPLLSRLFASKLFHVSYDRALYERERQISSQNPFQVIRGVAVGLHTELVWPLVIASDNICTKVMIIHGRHDGVFPLEQAQKLHLALPQSSLHIIDDASHNVQMEKPQQVAQLILQFIMHAKVS